MKLINRITNRLLKTTIRQFNFSAFTKSSKYLLFAFILFSACKPDQTKSNSDLNKNLNTDTITSSKLKLNPGDFVPRVNCSGNENLSYALYIPQKINLAVKNPVLFLFDPHANGALPINKYRDLADKYGYILIGSNDSKNGASREFTSQVISSLLKSSFELLLIDDKRIYAGGFSGGGRVASMLAFSSAGCIGLVTCGAGFPKEVWTTTPPSCIIGIAGDGDMNLNELESIKVDEPNLKNRYELIRFDGIHEWPPINIFEQAFLAFEATGINDGVISKDDKHISELNDSYQALSDNLSADNNYIYQAKLYERWINNLGNLTDVTVIKNSYKDLLKRADYKKAIYEEEKLFDDEKILKSKYLDAIGKQDTGWWKDQMKSLQNEVTSSTIGKKNMINRVTGTLSLTCFMNLNQSIGSNQKDAMEYFSYLYRTIDPTNPETWYLAAVVAGKKSDYPQVYNYLSRAVSIGFHDAARAQSEPAFSMMISDPEFNQIINRISK